VKARVIAEQDDALMDAAVGKKSAADVRMLSAKSNKKSRYSTPGNTAETRRLAKKACKSSKYSKSSSENSTTAGVTETPVVPTPEKKSSSRRSWDGMESVMKNQEAMNVEREKRLALKEERKLKRQEQKAELARLEIEKKHEVEMAKVRQEAARQDQTNSLIQCLMGAVKKNLQE